MRGRRLTWTVGGVGLIGSGVAGILLSATLGSSLTDTLALLVDVLWAAAVLVFAIGSSVRDSVVARRPLGLITLALVAVSPLALWIVGLFQDPTDPTPLIPWEVTTFVPLALSLVAVVQIGRADVVPRRWRWAPAVALGVSVASVALGQALMTDQASAAQLVGLASALGMLGFLTRTVGLGILALVAVASERPASVPVFSSPNDSAPDA
ncbi:hypothetical protein E1I21_09305 [Microbacterium oleivorans]|uniref:hypothetical protein n=1 Tax=Microbacterium oleivorans TaxID=273677 RepID=UPI0009782F46|nr:hypothetical protein [Microbacterium oleivorans]AZS42981.1 hypothetical protein BWL13_00523 [Microbacterium oleivorans]THE07010.1 hypothetical protein E1I21_09305 [Microbacterium oleivorans]